MFFQARLIHTTKQGSNVRLLIFLKHYSSLRKLFRVKTPYLISYGEEIKFYNIAHQWTMLNNFFSSLKLFRQDLGKDQGLGS
jgi:hypothetical protein